MHKVKNFYYTVLSINPKKISNFAQLKCRHLSPTHITKSSLMSNTVLYISQEIAPYLPANPVSTLGYKLPQVAQENGYEVRIFMPKYACINERRNQLHEVIRLSGMNVVIDDTDHPLIIKVATLQPSRLQVYFIDSDDYFTRKAHNDLEINVFPDENDERLMFFAYGVIETVKKLRWEPRVIHCQGWISALAPLYIKTLYADDPMFNNVGVVYSLFDDAFEGNLDKRFVDKLKEVGISEDILANIDIVDHVALNKLAIDYADIVTVVSPNVNPELIEYARSRGKEVIDCTENIDNFEPYINAYGSLIKNED